MTKPLLSQRFDPLSAEQRDDPFTVLELARREQPVFYSPESDLWVVTRHADVLAVLKDHGAFSSTGALKSAAAPFPPEVLAILAEGYPEMPYIIEVDPPLHDRIRGLVTKTFTPRRVAALEPVIQAIVDELLAELPLAGEADIVERFAWPLPLRVLGELLGLPRSDLAQLHEWGNDWMLVQQEGPLEQRLRHAKGTVSLQRYFVEAVAQRGREQSNDLIGALVAARAEIDPPLTDVEIAGLPLDLMVAGHVTVTRAIGSTIRLILDHPSIADELLDPEQAPRVIEEVLRLESPAQGLFRRATRAVQIGGATIPAGARVMAHFASANRDASVFATPDDYCPARTDLSRHVAFGKGVHFCIGAPLARLELGIALPALLRALPGLRAAPDAEAVREPLFFARGFERLPVVWGQP
jgi:cytochrome P450